MNVSRIISNVCLLIYYSNSFYWVLVVYWASIMAQIIKKSACSAGDPVCREILYHLSHLGREDSLEEEMATYSSILAWRSLWTEEPGGLQSMGLQRVRHIWVNNTLLYIRHKEYLKMNSIYILHVIMFTAMSNESMKEENELRIKFLVYKFVPMENIDISQLLVTSKLCFGYFPWNLLVISLTCLKTDLETPL